MTQPSPREQSTTSDEATAKAQQAMEKAHVAADKAKDVAESAKDSALEHLFAATDSLRERAEDEDSRVPEVAAKAVDSVERTTSYMREKSPQEMVQEFEAFAREHPMQAVGTAVIAGFLLGRLLR